VRVHVSLLQDYQGIAVDGDGNVASTSRALSTYQHIYIYMYICIIIYKREILYRYIYEYQGVAVDGDGNVAGRGAPHARVRPHPTVAAIESDRV